MGNPLVPHPSSLNLNISLGEAEDENKTAVRWVCVEIKLDDMYFVCTYRLFL